MIKREAYMKRIRPFIGGELIKVMTGIRRAGKSVMLELIKDELTASGIDPSQFISINFEDMRYMHLQNAEALPESPERFTSSLMKSRRSRAGKSASIPCASLWTAIFISQAPMPGCCPGNSPLI